MTMRLEEGLVRSAKILLAKLEKWSVV